MTKHIPQPNRHIQGRGHFRTPMIPAKPTKRD